MKQFFSVLRFELSGFFKNKVFMGMTLALVIIVAGVLTYPRISDALSSRDQAGSEISTDNAINTDALPRLALVNAGGVLKEDGLAAFSSSLLQYQIEIMDTQSDNLRDQVMSGQYDGAIVLYNSLRATYITRNLGMYDSTSTYLTAALEAAYRTESLAALGASKQEIPLILHPPVSVAVETLGVSQMETFFYTYVLIFALYMAILIYGQLVATAVATEKGSRTMELLVTSARPNSLMFGKVIGSGLAGLMQMMAIFGSAVLFYYLNASSWAGNEIIASIFGMPLPIVGYTLLFFVLGYFIYAFLFGAMGSLASRTEDVNTMVLPITFAFIAAFIVVMTSMASGNIDNALMVFCSYFPLTSPMAMFVRIAMSSPAWYEIVLSVILLIGVTAFIGVLAARIYRIGVLMYGKPPKLNELLRVLRAARRARA